MNNPLKIWCNCYAGHNEVMQQTLQLEENGIAHVNFKCNSCGSHLDGVFMRGTHKWESGGEG